MDTDTHRRDKTYITGMCLLNDTELSNSYPSYFVIKQRNIVIAHSETTMPTWVAILKTIWNSMELKRVIFNTTFNLIEKEQACVHDILYHRGDIILPFTMKNANDTFKREIMYLIAMNEYTIDITIRWTDSDKTVHYKNY